MPLRAANTDGMVVEVARCRQMGVREQPDIAIPKEREVEGEVHACMGYLSECVGLGGNVRSNEGALHAVLDR